MNIVHKLFRPIVVVLILIIISTNFVICIRTPILIDYNELNDQDLTRYTSTITQSDSIVESGSFSRGTSRVPRSLGFQEFSNGLPTSGEYNYVAIGYIDNDNNIDIAYGAEDYGPFSNTLGLYANFSNSNFSWSPASSGLPTGRSWGGVQLGDADGDGYIELYAADEGWGSNSNSGLNVWEYRSGSWTNSGTHVSSPLTSGRPDNVILTNMTGDNKLDLIISNSSGSGLTYFENGGGNPVSWTRKSNNLPTSAEYTTIAVADMNKDGLKDIVACDYGGGEHIFIQRTTGNLWADYSSGISVSGTCLGVAIGDVNNDTHQDIVFGGQGGGLKCLLGNSGGSGGTSFTWTAANVNLPTNGQYWKIDVTDIDLDGDIDIIAPRSYTDNKGIEIYLGNGTTNPGINMGWTKAANTNLPTVGSYASVTCHDLNNDGSSDIVATSWGSGIKVFLNNLSINTDNTPPGKVNDLKVEKATANSITINWTAPADNDTTQGSGPVQSYDIRYSNSNITLANWASANQCDNEPTPATPGANQNYTITGLSPGTLYYIALRSIDERPNLSQLSNIVLNTTLGIVDTIRPGQILNLQAINPTNNSINLTWTAPADNGSIGSSGSVVEYEIRYNTTQITNLTWGAAKKVINPPTPSSPGTLENFKVTGLTSETTYYFAIKARDERPNWGLISNSASNTTLINPDITPPSSIDDLTTSDPTDNTINLTWTAVGDDFNIGTATQYDIRYATSTITDQTWASANQCMNPPVPKIADSSEFYLVTGLNPQTTYYFAIKVSDDESHWSGLSNIASGTTLASMDITPPGKITDLAVGDVTTTTAKLTWTAPGDDDNSGIVAGYEIRFYTEPITEALWDISNITPSYPTPVEPGNAQEHTVTGLISNKKYYFAVKAFDERPNYSLISNVVNATTQISTDIVPPAAVTDLTVTSTTLNLATLTWTAPGDDGNTGTASGYEIKYAETFINDTIWETAEQCNNQLIPKSSGEQESFTVTGLFSGTKYYFALKSFDERPNFSLLSNIANTTTYFSEDTTPPAQITDLTVIETTESTATLTWTATGDDENTGTATKYEVRRAGIGITSVNWLSAEKVNQALSPKPAGQKETLLVTNLEKGTTYYFAVRAADEKPNWSPVSNSPSAKTQGGVKSILDLLVTTDKTILTSGQTANIEVKVLAKLEQTPIEQAEVQISVNNEVLELTPTNGLTDSNGIFTTTVKALDVVANTMVRVDINASKVGFKSNATQLTFTIKPKTNEVKRINLKITEQNIYLSKSDLTEGDVVTIYANISNIGNLNATNINVRFLVDNQLLGDVESISKLDMYKYIIITKTWTAVSGNHTIKVELIPSDSSLESDNSDNSAEKLVTVKQKPVDGNGKDPDDKDDVGIISGSTFLIIIVIVIIIILLLVAFAVMRKRKHDTELKSKHEIRLEPEGQFDISSESRTTMEEDTSMEFETAATTIEPEVQSEDTSIETGEMEYTEEVGEEPEQSETDIQEETEFEITESQTELTPPPDISEAESELEETGGPTEFGDEQNEQIENNDGSIACPICQSMIPLYTSHCPKCNSELRWE